MSEFYQNNEKTTSVWLTPPEMIRSLGQFNLDPCSPNNLKWKIADKFYSLENGQDGLKLSWSPTERIWLNPPYDNWVAFIKKLSEHGNGIALILNRTETKGFFDYVWPKADSILFIKARVKFLRADGSKAGSATMGSVLIAYGKNNTIALENSGIEGKLIKLR